MDPNPTSNYERQEENWSMLPFAPSADRFACADCHQKIYRFDDRVTMRVYSVRRSRYEVADFHRACYEDGAPERFIEGYMGDMEVERMEEEERKAAAEGRIERCKSCKAPIYWLRNITSLKSAPIDAEPAEDGKGNCLIDLEHSEYRVLGMRERQIHNANEKHAPLHKNHFVTCTDATRWGPVNGGKT
jgi:hypothetical protein